MHSGGAAWLVPLLRTLTPHRVALATHFDAMGIFDVYFIWVLRSYDTRILQDGSISHIRHVSDTDTSWIWLGYVSNPYWKYWIRIHSDTCIGHVWTKLDTACEGPTSCVSAWRSGQRFLGSSPSYWRRLDACSRTRHSTQAVRQDARRSGCQARRTVQYMFSDLFFSCLIFVSTSRWTHVMIVELFIYELLVL